MTDIALSQEKKVVRPNCPLYGFYGTIGDFMDQKGNQCPLKEGYSPCILESRGEKPNWNECPFNKSNPGLLEKLRDHNIFPNELHPEGVNSWRGIKFADWSEYILKGTPLPIEV